MGEATRTEQEQSYAAELEAVFKRNPLPPLEILANFAMYVPRQNLTTFLCKYEIFKRILNVQGSIVECGVLGGGGLMTWAQLSAIFEPTNHQRKVIGFDTFEGFPSVGPEDGEGKRIGDMAKDSLPELGHCINLFDMNRFVGHIPKVELVKGDAVDTIPKYLEKNPHLVVSLLFLDFDIYQPTKAALKHFLSRMPKGAILAFDELNLKNWPGETQAAFELLDFHQWRFERFPWGSTICFAEV